MMYDFKAAARRGRENLDRVKAEEDDFREKVLRFAAEGLAEYNKCKLEKSDPSRHDQTYQLAWAETGSPVLTFMNMNAKCDFVSGDATIYPFTVVHNNSQVRVEIKSATELEPKLLFFLRHPDVLRWCVREGERREAVSR